MVLKKKNNWLFALFPQDEPILMKTKYLVHVMVVTSDEKVLLYASSNIAYDATPIPSSST